MTEHSWAKKPHYHLPSLQQNHRFSKTFQGCGPTRKKTRTRRPPRSSICTRRFAGKSSQKPTTRKNKSSLGHKMRKPPEKGENIPNPRSGPIWLIAVHPKWPAYPGGDSERLFDSNRSEYSWLLPLSLPNLLVPVTHSSALPSSPSVQWNIIIINSIKLSLRNKNHKRFFIQLQTTTTEVKVRTSCSLNQNPTPNWHRSLHTSQYYCSTHR